MMQGRQQSLSRNAYSSILESHQQERALAVWRPTTRYDHGRSDVRQNHIHRLVLPRRDCGETSPQHRGARRRRKARTSRARRVSRYVLFLGLQPELDLSSAHVHLNEPGRTDWEGFWTGTRAAVSGGVTTVVDMPLNSIPPTTTVENLEIKRNAAQGQCWSDVAFWGGAIPGNQVGCFLFQPQPCFPYGF